MTLAIVNVLPEPVTPSSTWLFWPSSIAEIKASKGYDQVIDDIGKMPGAEWFSGAKLNFAENLLRYRDDRPALVFTGEGQDSIRLTYAEVYDEVARVAKALREVIDSYDTTGCEGNCGDGTLDPGETCDSSAFGAQTCLTAAGRQSGSLLCTDECHLDVSGCHTCGDGAIEGPEQCDGINLGGEDCLSQTGLSEGALTCDATSCTFDTSSNNLQQFSPLRKGTPNFDDSGK